MKVKKQALLKTLLLFILTNSTAVFAYPQKQSFKDSIPTLFQKFKYTSGEAILEQHSYFNFTNKSSVSPNIENFGLMTVFTPPYFINPFTVNFRIFNEEVKVHDYVWYPSESVFKGEAVSGVAATSRVVPLADKRGGIYEVVLKNTTSKSVKIPIIWSFNAKPGRVKSWGFYGSRTMAASKDSVNIKAIPSGCSVDLDNCEASVVAYGTAYTYDQNIGLKSTVVLKAGETIKTGIVFIGGERTGETIAVAKSVANNVAQNIANTRKHWFDALTYLMDNSPKLEGVSDKLQAYYNTGLLSLQSAKWEVPEFLFSPWYGSCGIDGGAMISYLWEMSYSSKYVSILSPQATRNHLIAYAKADMGTCYAVDPETGKGVGPLYSYNFYNYVRLVYDYVCLTGDFSILDEPVGKKTYLEYLYDFSLSKEDLKKPADLIDYGNTHNLLELYKTDAYTHYVPSPNSERVLIYEMLTELYHYKGKHTPDDLLERKKELTKAFKKELWNKDLGWLNTLDENKQRKICYSIQGFSPLRSGVLTHKMEEKLVKHLNEKEFLSEWGIYSLALQDKGYDPNDVDWGGPGVYTGAPPELIADLFNSGFNKQGLDLLKRITWWGELPYLPQAMRTNIKGYRENGRANIISGVTTSQYIIYGLFRIQLSPNSIEIHPIEDNFMKGVSFKGLKVRKKTIDVEVSKDRSYYIVTVDGVEKRMRSNKAFILKF